jgi:hypothetical protein
MSEEWRDVPNEPKYAVSSHGNVRGPRGIMSPWSNQDGYRLVDIRNKHWRVASLVMFVFVGPRSADKEVCHNDGTRTNDRLDNLRYGTRLENMSDKVLHGTTYKGADNVFSKLTENIVHLVRRRAILESRKDIAKSLSISVATVSKICSRKVWTHLPLEPGEIGTYEGDAARVDGIRVRRRAWLRKGWKETRFPGLAARDELNDVRGWKEIRTIALEESRGFCCRCGEPRQLLAKHILERINFSTDEEYHSQENLACFCRSCAQIIGPPKFNRRTPTVDNSIIRPHASP